MPLHSLTKCKCSPHVMCNKFQSTSSNEQVRCSTECQYTTVWLTLRQFVWSGMNILAPYQIDIVKWSGFSNGKIILIWYWFFFLKQIMILENGNNIYLIFVYFLLIIKKGILKFTRVSLHFNFQTLNLHAQLEMNGILYITKNSNNCIRENQ